MFIGSTHHCGLAKPFDLKKLYKTNSIFYNLILPWIIIHENHPKCKQFLISKAAVNKEIRRQLLNKHWWIVHPFSKFNLLWESLMMIVYFIALFLIPFSISFIILDYRTKKLFQLNPVIYGFCWFDIIHNCITGYRDENGDVILNQQKIFKKYMKSFMFLDVITSLPYDYITISWRKIPEPKELYIVATLLNLIPLLKCARYLTLRLSIKQVFLYFNREDIASQMFLTLLAYIYVVHWFTCFSNCILLLKIYAKEEMLVHMSFMEWNEIREVTNRYERALFIVLENFSANSYGSIQPDSSADILLCSILMILGRCFESYIIIMFIEIVADGKSSESKYEEIVNQLLAYAREKQLPAYMKRRLLAFYKYRFRNSYFREKKILSSLSDGLRKEVILHSCRRLVENAEIFQNLPHSILVQIVTNLKPELYLAKDIIIKAGTQGDCMFFLSSGSVSVQTSTGKEVCCLKDGAYFGEVALLVQDERRVASVLAVEVCEVYRLDRKDFRKCIAVHSDLFAKIEKVATERMQRTVLIEEEYKHFMMRSSFTRLSQTSRDSKQKKIINT